MHRDTMFYLNTSLRSHSRPMGVLDGSCLHLIWEATHSFLFLSPMESDVAALLSLLSLSLSRFLRDTRILFEL